MSVETLNVCMGVLYSQGIFDRWHIRSYCSWSGIAEKCGRGWAECLCLCSREEAHLDLLCLVPCSLEVPLQNDNFLSQWRFLLPHATTLSSHCLIANIYLALLHYCKLWLAIKVTWWLWQFGIWRALMKLNTAFACHPSLWMGKWK